MIERSFAEQLDLTEEDVEMSRRSTATRVSAGCSRCYADRQRTYCLYEAPSPDAILAAARKADIPADAVVEVGAATPQFSGGLRDWADSVG